jgi:hypothetical protein
LASPRDLRKRSKYLGSAGTLAKHANVEEGGGIEPLPREGILVFETSWDANPGTFRAEDAGLEPASRDRAYWLATSCSSR